jgi:hypothetical protein
LGIFEQYVIYNDFALAALAKVVQEKSSGINKSIRIEN